MSYGDSEKVIGNSRLKKLYIITKIKLPNKKKLKLKKLER
jgi:hypothetical protein